MMITCACGGRLEAAEDLLNQPVVCPRCGAIVRLAFARGFTPPPRADDFVDRLTVVGGPRLVGTQFLLGSSGPIEAGKLPGKAIFLDGTQVSRSHCRLLKTATAWRLEDQGATNGTMVNGARIATVDLRDGDVLAIGEYQLRFASVRKPAPPQPEAEVELQFIPSVEEFEVPPEAGSEPVYEIEEEPRPGKK